MIQNMVHGLFELLYPPHCIICKASLTADSPHPYVCPECDHTLKPNHPPFCPKCSRFLGAHPESALCGACRRHPPQFDFAWSGCLYTDHLKKMIHDFKYHQRTYLKKYLAHCMIDFIKKYNLDIQQFDFLLPIPLAATKLRERGYNQSCLLAQELKQTYKIPLAPQTLIRIKDTKAQVQLSQKERWTNMHGAFRIKNSRTIINRNILLIDDLLTTGATASHAAQTLKEAGADRVGVLTVAIAE